MATNATRDPRGTQLYNSLRSSISAGKLQPGECLPSSRQLQQEYGISYHATLAALARLEKEGQLVRRQGSGTFVADTPVRIGSNGNGKSVRVVAAFTSHFNEMFLGPLFEAVRDELETSGCNSSVSILRKESTWDAEEWDARIREAAEVGNPDVALQIHPSHYALSPPPVRPTVFVAQDMETVWEKACGHDVVTVDARQSAVVAARYLKKIGCKSVAMVGVRYKEGYLSPYSYLRFQGFQQAWGPLVPESMVFFGKTHTPSGGAEVVPGILAIDPLPDAVFCTTDDQAYGLCHALLSHGIQPGKDMKVIGCDGQPPLFPEDPLLTSVAAPLPELGKAAARMALQRADNPDGVANRVLLSCTLRKGDTA